MGIIDWSSDVCSSDRRLLRAMRPNPKVAVIYVVEEADSLFRRGGRDIGEIDRHADRKRHHLFRLLRRGLNRPAEQPLAQPACILQPDADIARSEEHTSEPQSPMSIS